MKETELARWLVVQCLKAIRGVLPDDKMEYLLTLPNFNPIDYVLSQTKKDKDFIKMVQDCDDESFEELLNIVNPGQQGYHKHK